LRGIVPLPPDSRSNQLARNFTPDLFGVRPRPRTKAAQLREAEKRRDLAYASLPKAVAEISQAKDAAEPFARAFWHAHAALELASGGQTPLTKDQLFAAYDLRLEAGHAWWPHRRRLDDAAAWLKALQKEIKECDALLGD
jgi:hypothetical protein